MDDEKSKTDLKEYKAILKILNKKESKKNIEILHFAKYDLFKKEGDHQIYDFYVYLYHNHRDELEDEKSFIPKIRDYYNEIYFLFIMVIGSVLLFICYNYFTTLLNNGNKWLNLLSIIILATTITTGSFFVVKIFIDNQIKKSEKDMLKEYKDMFKEYKGLIEKSNRVRDKQIKKSEKDMLKEYKDLIEDSNKVRDKKFDEQNKRFDDLVDLIKEIKNNNHQNNSSNKHT